VHEVLDRGTLHRSRFAALIVVALILTGATGLTAAASTADGTLTGAGSTLVAP
jgi:hypothetical protein